eukprot:6192717-Pleurochrysis_carterae.AAC.1
MAEAFALKRLPPPKYGIPMSTFWKMVRYVRRGECNWTTSAGTKTCSKVKQKPTLVGAAEVWWLERLQCYDVMPHLTGVLVPPVGTHHHA